MFGTPCNFLNPPIGTQKLTWLAVILWRAPPLAVYGLMYKTETSFCVASCLDSLKRFQ